MAEILTVPICGAEMQITKFGSGERSLVILPGLTVRNVSFSAPAIEAQYRALSERYTVYLPDRPDTLPDGCTMRSLALDTVGALSSLGVGSMDVFGVSQGGMLALYMAAYCPERVEHLILGSVADRWSAESDRIFAEWRSLALCGDDRGLTASFLDRIYSPATLAAIRESALRSVPAYTQAERDRFVRLIDLFYTVEPIGALPPIQAKTLILGAEGDGVFTAEPSRSMADKLGCELYLYGAEYGHAVYDEAADYPARLLEFLSR